MVSVFAVDYVTVGAGSGMGRGFGDHGGRKKLRWWYVPGHERSSFASVLGSNMRFGSGSWQSRHGGIRGRYLCRERTLQHQLPHFSDLGVPGKGHHPLDLVPLLRTLKGVSTVPCTSYPGTRVTVIFSREFGSIQHRSLTQLLIHNHSS